MKKLLLTLFALLIAAGLFSCEENGKRVQTDENGIPYLYFTEFGDISEYTIVRPDKGDTEKKELSRLRTALGDRLGVELEVGTDWGGEKAKEILVGLTSRDESQKAANGLLAGDYRILVDGKKIIIVGGSDSALEKAVDFVLNYCINEEKKGFYVPSGDGYLKTGSYIADSISIGGTDISEFKLTSEYFDTKKLSDAMVGAIGKELPVEKYESITDGGKYIIVENTGLSEDKFSFSVENGNLYIRGSYNSAEDAISYFCGDFAKENGGRKLDLKEGFFLEGSAGKQSIYTKDQLMQVLTDVYNDPDSFIIGEQIDAAKLPSEVFTKFTERTGEMPGIVGIDLGHYGLRLSEYSTNYKPTSALYQSRVICELTDFAAKGGIVTASCHYSNPSGNFTDDTTRGHLGEDISTEGYEKAMADLITEGTEYNTQFKKQLEVDAIFLTALRDNGVPVIWRPFHEMNGNWFWWGITQNENTMSAEVYKNLWIYIYNFFTVEKGLDNLIWSYSPNVSANEENKPGQSTMSTMYCYPGDEYVDMVGVDWYFGKMDNVVADGYESLTDATGKIGALAEIGVSGNARAEDGQNQEEIFNSMDFYGYLKEISKSGCNFSYALTWTSVWSLKAMGKDAEFMAMPDVLGLSEVAELFGALDK